jgi:iron(III) transport system substrate-binding protein
VRTLERMRTLPAAVLLLAAVLAGCGGGATGSGETITVYSGREEAIVGPLLERFEEEIGIEVRVRYGDSAELAATLAEEGSRTPADVFFSQDPGSLGALEDEGLLARLPDEVLERVEPRFRDPDGHWVGTSGRVRVLVYNTERLSEDEVPETVFALTEPAWRGRVGLAPTNASFQAFVTAMRLSHGEERTRAWLEGIVANRPRIYARNMPTVEAVASGEVDIGLVNHYYLALARAERPDLPAANRFLRPGDPGALVSVAAVAVLDSTGARESAERFAAFLLEDESQRFYSRELPQGEYPLVAGVAPAEGLPPLDGLRGPELELDRLGPELRQTLRLLSDVGLTR